MDLGVFDYALTAGIVIALPVYGVWEHRRLQDWVKVRDPDSRVKAYRLTMIVEWALVFLLLLLWFGSQRDPSGLGLTWEPGHWWWMGLGLTLAAGVLLIVQSIVIGHRPDRLRSVARQLGSLRSMIPTDGREARMFGALCVTAGVCEEMLYRGYLIAVLSVSFGTWVAVVLSSVAFGVGHVYQGAAGIAKTGSVGFVMAGIYLLTGSLWAPMALHAILDLSSGHLGRRALEHAAATSAPDRE